MKNRMRMPRHLPSLLLLGVGASLVLSAPAAAYIDPGTGSIVLQMLVAGALGAAFAVKRFWRRIAASLRSAFKRS
jgi:hypothetical protein